MLNALLAPLERVLAAGREEPGRPVVFVVGLPRTGTTLAAQVLATAHEYGYPSNLLARFWRAPSVGAYLDRALRALAGAGRTAAGFDSVYGRTSGPWGVHELGYFWDRWFDRGQTTHRLTPSEREEVPVADLKRSLAGLERAFRASLLFSNNTWCTLQASYLARVLPASIFVVCERDPLWIAQSLLIGRRRRHGDRDRWWSVRPRAFERLTGFPWNEQIGGQVAHLLGAQEEELEAVPSSRTLRLPYPELCREPSATARRVWDTVRRVARDESWRGPRPLGLVPEAFEPRNVQRVSDQDLRSLQEGLDAFADLLDRHGPTGTGPRGSG